MNVVGIGGVHGISMGRVLSCVVCILPKSKEMYNTIALQTVALQAVVPPMVLPVVDSYRKYR